MLKTRLLSNGAMLPCFMTKGAACADVFLPADVTIPPHSIAKVPLDIAFDIPVGYKIVMYPRSSLLVKHGVVQPVSIIDADYHGNVHVPLFNATDKEVTFKGGERVAQIELQTCLCTALCDWHAVENERDQNGFGGTGK